MGPSAGWWLLPWPGLCWDPPSPNWVWGLCWTQPGPGATPSTGRCSQDGCGVTFRMFPAAQMAALAQELLPCRAELLQGGLGGPNRGQVLRHLLGGRALLVPYDEDSNHAPSCRRGHKAHWALINGVVVAVPPQEPLGPQFRQDPEIPNVFHAQFGEESLLGEGFSFGDPRGVQERSGGVHGAGEGSQAKEMPDLGRGSHFGEGSQPDSLPDLRWGSRFGEGSHFGEGSRFKEGFCPDSLPNLSRGCQFEEGSQTKALPNFSRGCQFEEHSHPESVPDLGRGSRPESLPDGGRGSPFGPGILVLALQGKSPRPQLWALGELGASNAQLDELSPRRWGGGFVVPPGGVREGLGGQAVLLHPRETPPQ